MYQEGCKSLLKLKEENDIEIFIEEERLRMIRHKAPQESSGYHYIPSEEQNDEMDTTFGEKIKNSERKLVQSLNDIDEN